MSSVDAYITTLQQQAEDARAARNAVLHELLNAGGDHWTETTLGAVAEVDMGQSPPGDTYNTEGLGMPFMQGSAEFGEHSPRPVKFCSAPLKIAEIGDLLLSVRAPVGDSNIADQRIAIGRGLAAIRGNEQAITFFLRLQIQSATPRLLATSGTGMFSSITGKNLRELSLALPPLSEQEEVVGIVSAMDNVIGAAQEAVSSARELRSGLLSDLLSGDHEIPATYDRLLGAA
jgi:type I restriction enzyme S subunit